MTPSSLLELFADVCTAVHDRLGLLSSWEHLGERASHPGQYVHDVAADEVVLAMLDRTGVGVLSEESGLRRSGADVIVIVDPIDGSTNASRAIPWFATSLCAVDADGPLASMVTNQATGTRFHATRGGGAFRDGRRIAPSNVHVVAESIVAISGMPTRPLGSQQFRALGAAALDLCAVADGTLDGFVDCSVDAHGIWDFAGAALICAEAGAVVVDAHGRDLWTLDPSARRTPVGAATRELNAALLAARNS